MAVPNQISHRESFRQRSAAGLVQTNPKPGQPAPVRRIQRPDNGKVMTLAERLGFKPPIEETPPPAEAVGLPPLAPPPTANVDGAPEPAVVVDPPAADVEKAMVAPSAISDAFAIKLPKAPALTPTKRPLL